MPRDARFTGAETTYRNGKQLNRNFLAFPLATASPALNAAAQFHVREFFDIKMDCGCRRAVLPARGRRRPELLGAADAQRRPDAVRHHVQRRLGQLHPEHLLSSSRGVGQSFATFNVTTSTQSVATVASHGSRAVSWQIRGDKAKAATITMTLRDASGATVKTVQKAITVTN
jgi:hypothetical protein